MKKLAITVIVAVKNEEANLAKCLATLEPVQRVIVVDSQSADGSAELAAHLGAEVFQFNWSAGYPKKRQWVLDTVAINTPWVMFVDADERVDPRLWAEISQKIDANSCKDAWLVRKRLHFLGRRIRFGGFSHRAVLIGRVGRVRFERLVEESASGLDMEVHERLIIDGATGSLREELHHEDSKGLAAYLERHNRYSSWEASVRRLYLSSGVYGQDSIRPRLFGNVQELRRALKLAILRVPFEPLLWFLYHYFARFGFLEGRRGWILSRIRWNYIAEVRFKCYELKLIGGRGPTAATVWHGSQK